MFSEQSLITLTSFIFAYSTSFKNALILLDKISINISYRLEFRTFFTGEIWDIYISGYPLLDLKLLY